MRINILTLFPEFFETPLQTSMLFKAVNIKKLEVKIYNLRDFGLGPRKQVDDRPYGGGAGMVLRVDVMAKAIEQIKKENPKTKIILLTPKGKTFQQNLAQDLSKEKSLTFICGHYEGFDERIRNLVDMEISIGNFVLTGGEPAALVMIDAIIRLIPGVLDAESVKEESFSIKSPCHSESADEESPTNVGISHSREIATSFGLAMTKGDDKCQNCLEYPHYTRPENFKDKTVPEILLSGNHAEVKKWRLQKAVEETQKRNKSCI
jgi:tRNA (guanine37-N1)-methyltransferase